MNTEKAYRPGNLHNTPGPLKILTVIREAPETRSTPVPAGRADLLNHMVRPPAAAPALDMNPITVVKRMFRGHNGSTPAAD